jgi:hypothetical protein
VIEELVAECMGKEGHKVFMEDEAEEATVQDIATVEGRKRGTDSDGYSQSIGDVDESSNIGSDDEDFIEDFESF